MSIYHKWFYRKAYRRWCEFNINLVMHTVHITQSSNYQGLKYISSQLWSTASRMLLWALIIKIYDSFSRDICLKTLPLPIALVLGFGSDHKIFLSNMILYDHFWSLVFHFLYKYSNFVVTGTGYLIQNFFEVH